MKVQRTKSELETALKEQLELLAIDCETFDNGKAVVGKSIATRLRVLLHDRGKSSRSLLGQLGLKFQPYFDTGKQRRRQRGIKPTGSYLVVVHAENKNGTVYVTFRPKLSEGPPTDPLKLSAFETWWNDPVIVASPTQRFHRRDAILHIADTDGGAHVDGELDPDYVGVKKGTLLNVWSRGDTAYFGPPPADGDFIPAPGIELAVVRQIAHEVLLTLARVRPDLATGYAYP